MKKEILLKTLMFLMILVAVIPYLYVIYYSPIGLDSAYYLTVSQKLKEGFSLYSEVKTGYTPFFFYAMAGLKSLFFEKNYTFDLSVYFITILISSFFLYKISMLYFKKNKLLSLLVVFFLLQITFWLEPFSVLLEYPSVMWGLASIWLLLAKTHNVKTLLISGLLFSCSFMTKQYGLGFLFLGYYVVVFMSCENKIRNSILLTISFLLPLVLYQLWNPAFFGSIWGGGYGTAGKESLFLEFVENLRNSYKYLLYRLPILVFSLILILVYAKNNLHKTVFLLLGILGFSLQFVFEPLLHYFHYMLPFFSILIVWPISFPIKSVWVKFLYLGLLLLTITFSLKRSYVRVINYNNTIKTEQKVIANYINQEIQPGESVYISDYRLIYLYYLIHSDPDNLNYSFGVALTPDVHYKRMQEADCVISWNNYKTKYFNGLITDDVESFFNKEKKAVYEKNHHLNELTNIFEKDQVVVIRNKK